MAIEAVKQYSVIYPHFKNKVRWRGVFLAISGAFLLLYGGIFTAAEELEKWGTTIWLVSISLIALGWIPYKRLCWLENHPDELIITDKDLLHYISSGPVVTIDLKQIDSVNYLEKRLLYGIAISFRRPLAHPLEQPKVSFSMRVLQSLFLRDVERDLFLPFFSEETKKEIEEVHRGALAHCASKRPKPEFDFFPRGRIEFFL